MYNQIDQLNTESKVCNEDGTISGGGDWLSNLDLFLEVDYFVEMMRLPGRTVENTENS